MVELFREAGFPGYRAQQVWQWLYVHGTSNLDTMKNVPATLKSWLSKNVSLDPCVCEKISGPAGSTQKLLVRLRDGEHVEQVLIPARDRYTVCVSSQVGCRCKCAFCASGQSGFRRNLEAGEIVNQVLLAREIYGKALTHVVFMGVGEPLDNYDQVLKTVRIINDKDGINIGARRITISTCGLVPEIKRLAGENLQIELSVSLHAPDDKLRSRLMPIDRKYPLHDLIDACVFYVKKTKRIITFEYALIENVNDTKPHAEALAKLLTTLQCRVNLIPLSEVTEYQGKPASEETAEIFISTLKKAGINATLRMSKGGSIEAACGQLRSSTLK